jgi:hypothetical protein
LAGFTTQKKERRLQNGFQPFVRLQQQRVRLLSGERVSARGGSAEARAVFATRDARVGTAFAD